MSERFEGSSRLRRSIPALAFRLTAGSTGPVFFPGFEVLAVPSLMTRALPRIRPP